MSTSPRIKIADAAAIVGGGAGEAKIADAPKVAAADGGAAKGAKKRKAKPAKAATTADGADGGAGAGGAGGGTAGAAADAVLGGGAPKKARKAKSTKRAATDATADGAGADGAAADSAASNAADDDADDAANGAGAEAGAGAAPKKVRAVKIASPHAGVDTSIMVAGSFLPAPSMAAFIASLPPRRAGVKVVCYNVNGLRAAVKGDRKAEFLAWIAAEDPDVLCLQETKADADVVAKEKFASLFPSLPHAVFAPGDPAIDGFKKGYAGVAIFSKTAPLETMIGLGDAAHDAAGRFVAARFAWGAVVSVYVPNSGQKLDRLEYRTASWDVVLRARLGALTAATGGRVLVVGDFNVAFNDGDVEGHKAYRNKIAGFCDGERDGFAALLASGFRDPWRAANPNVKEYSESRHRGRVVSGEKPRPSALTSSLPLSPRGSVLFDAQ